MQHFLYPTHSQNLSTATYQTMVEHSIFIEKPETELMLLDSAYSIVYMNCSPTDPEVFLRMMLLCPGSHQSFMVKAGEISISYFQNRPLHQHDFFEIMYVIKGEVIQHIEKGCFPYSAGQCCFINKGTQHIEEYHTDFEAVFFGMSDDFLLNMIRGDILYAKDTVAHKYDCDIYRSIYQSTKDQEPGEKKYIDYVPINDATSAELTELMDQIILECISQKPGCSFITLGLCARFISTLETSDKFYKNIICLNSSSDDFLFLRIKLFLETHNGRVRRGVLSAQLHYSGDYLNRIVKNHTGMTLVKFGLSICLKKAKWMLQNTTLTVGEIIQQLGFSNRSYFYRLFEKKFGMSPATLRSENS